MVGDVTQDEVLRAAGLEHARAVVVALETDADTVYVTLSARAMRPDVVIVARARTTGSKASSQLAGATRAVNPQRIGGRRLAAFALQPARLRVPRRRHARREPRLAHPAGARRARVRDLADRALDEAALRERTGALLLAVRLRRPAARSSPTRPATWWCRPRRC